MNVKTKRKYAGPAIIVAGLFFLLTSAILKDSQNNESANIYTALKNSLSNQIETQLLKLYIPVFSFVEEDNHKTSQKLVDNQIRSLLPLYGYLKDNEQVSTHIEDQMTIDMILFAEANEEYTVPTEDQDVLNNQNSSEQIEQELQMQQEQQEQNMLELVQQENATVQQPFVPRNKQVDIALDSLRDYEALVKQFYTIDRNTLIGNDQLNVEALQNKDLTISKDASAPQILIYHTHSQEAFADSVSGDTSTTIVGVGDYLAQILTETYGYNVLHHTGQYDVEVRDDAYSKALPAIEQILKDNPSIQVVIDLHRDAMAEETHLVMDLDGKPTAQFMFFNGLSRTKKTGNISYLYNENIGDNLAFSFQMQMKAVQFYPGLTRKIYLKGYRYNMHLCPRTLLVELGAQNNTVEEVMNACDPLAHMLNMVLSGE